MKHELNGGILKTYHLDSCYSDCVGKPLSYRPCRTDSACHHKSEVKQVLASHSGRVVFRIIEKRHPMALSLFTFSSSTGRVWRKRKIHFKESDILPGVWVPPHHSPYRPLPQTCMLTCCVLVMLLLLVAILKIWSCLWWMILFQPVDCAFRSSFLCDKGC